MDIHELLTWAVEWKASDVHVSAGLPPLLRINGELERLDWPVVSREQALAAIQATANAGGRDDFIQRGETDYACSVDGVARFRANAFGHDRGVGIVFRVIPDQVASLEELAAPALFGELACLPRGLVLVTGATGTGKSTTLAAMVEARNIAETGHILSIEDPVEFLHTPKKCLISQREVHRDTKSFSTALRSALREDPDVIMVGELRDLETIRLALTAAETGHLVLATVHAGSAPKSINRLIDVFPGNEQAMIRGMLSESLRAVIAQTLLRRVGGGRVAAHEIMLVTPAIRNLIREARVAQMYSAMQTGRACGMQTLEMCLADLVRQGLVLPEEAARHADNPEYA